MQSEGRLASPTTKSHLIRKGENVTERGELPMFDEAKKLKAAKRKRSNLNLLG